MSGISLKLKLNTGVGPASTSPNASQPLTANGPRIKIRSSLPLPPSSQPTAPDAKKTKSGRASKPSTKVLDGRKRMKEDSFSEEELAGKVRAPPPKRVKIQVATTNTSTPTSAKTPITPALVFKQKGKPPRRNPGEGYDSEASDREEDPAIEEQFIIRILGSSENCEYLRQLIAEKKIGVARDVNMKFLDPDGRRATLTIRDQMYAATMVDLPCILEAMKSWDKRGWWKSADIAQMLLVFAPIKTEAEALTIPLPTAVDPVTHQYPHGITPPMQYARKRRFRKRLHKTQIEAMEDAVERLLKEDERSVHTSYEIVDPEAEYRMASQAISPASSRAGEDFNEFACDEYAEGKMDENGYYDQVLANQPKPEVKEEEVDLDLEAELEAALDEDYDTVTPSNLVATPQANWDQTVEEEDSGDESLDGEEEEGLIRNTVKDVDEAEKKRQMQEAAVRDDITDLEDRIAANLAAQATQSNPILRRRLEEGARKLRAELESKKAAIVDGED
ncbi:unnamed protein product [Blumeria hordei]|uniref:TAFII55 protein conserved region domain-containing protein n=1 Tax=Blumeria hordei TaxID=2867405 RepID=A0A383V347_BLUHO|nr:unnamed protein product [Blumeria hordei]